MAAKDKDTIYVDIDDEITGIIDKLKVSDGKVVALVLPKRAAVFQSIVNMKLLKRAADSSKKNLVLITSEAGLLPLAGAAGVHVAKTLTSKPEIPSAPQFGDDAEETVNEDESVDALADGDKPVGQLAGATPPPPPADGGVETLVLDDEDLPPEAAAAVKPGGKTFDPPAKGKGKGPKKNKKLSIPNFNKFRMWLIIGGAVLLLLILALIFMTIGSKATITIKTDATNVDTNLTLNLSTGAKSLDEANSILPAKLASQQKTYTAQAPTTGQKNNGNKASGSISMSAGPCSGTAPSDVPAGTGASSNGQTYITQSDVSFVPATHGIHCTWQSQADTTVVAQNAGASYNNATGFSVAGRSDVSVTVTSTISGGTDNIVHTVNQNDVNTAKSKIGTDTGIKQAVQNQLKGESLSPIDATYTAGTPVVASSPNVGQVADSVTVTETVTYTEFGVQQADLNKLVDNNANTQIDPTKQSILDRGLGQAVYNVNSMSATAAQLTLSTKVTAGPALNVDDIKQQSAGKKAAAIKSQLSNNPDVTNVDVKIRPFWLSSAPKKISKITVNIAKPTATVKTKSSGAGNP